MGWGYTPPTSGGGGGVTVHDDLTGKDAADQHPMGAVTNLVGYWNNVPYMNIVQETADVAAAVTYVTTNNMTNDLPDGAHTLVHDGSTAAIVKKVTNGVPYELADHQPQENDFWLTRVRIDGSFNVINGLWAVFVGNDLGIGSPHFTNLVGDTISIDSGTKTAQYGDIVFARLTDNATLNVPDGTDGDHESGSVFVYLEANSFTLTLNPSIGGSLGSIDSDGIYEFTADGTQMVVTRLPFAQEYLANRPNVENDRHQFTYTANTVGATGATETIVWDRHWHDITMDENCTFSFTPTTDASSIIVALDGAFTPTWPGSVLWPGGTEPTYAAPTLYEFSTPDGGATVYGRALGTGFA